MDDRTPVDTSDCGGDGHPDRRTGRISAGSSIQVTCAGFLDAFSDYRDGLLEEGLHAAFDRHRRECGSCGRYASALEVGVSVLLQGEIDVNAEEELDWLPLNVRGPKEPVAGPIGSGMAVAVASAVAVFLGAAAWAPSLFVVGVPDVEVAPVTASRPMQARVPGLFPSQTSFPGGLVEVDSEDAYRPLLYENLPLSKRNSVTQAAERDR